MMKYLSLLLISVYIVALSACSHTEEIYPIRFGNNDITAMMNSTEYVSFVDGGGEYTITVDNPDVVGVPTIDNDNKTLKITPVSKGISEVVIHDVRANKDAVLHVTVVDFHLSYTIQHIEGTNLNPYITKDDVVWFIRAVDNHCRVNVFRQGKVVAEGDFEITLGSESATMHIALHSDRNEELEGFEYQILESGRVLDIFNLWFGFGWDKIQASGRSQPIFYPTMQLKAPNGALMIGILSKN